MPLLDHFHPPLHGPRRWEGFHHSWAAFIAQQLNQDVLPAGYFAESEISVGPELEVDVATLETTTDEPVRSTSTANISAATAVWAPPRPSISVAVNFSRLESYEVRVYQDLGGAELRAAIELVSPRNKDRPASRRTFAVKCASYLQRGLGMMMIDVVTARLANLHEELFETLEVSARRRTWKSATGLYAIAYRAATARKRPRVEAWPEALELGQPLPTLPLWLAPDVCVPLDLEESYLATCRSLRISA